MDFSYDETQQAVANLAATVLRNEAEHARVEHAISGAAGYDETLWKALAQAGLLALALPESLGGDGFGAVEVAAVLSEVGRQTLPVPAFATLALGVLPVAGLGSTALQQELLPEVADGRIVTAGLRAVPSAPAAQHGRLTGGWIGVPYAAQAHRVLVHAGDGVYVVDPHASSATLVRTPTSSGAPEYTLRLDGTPAELLTNDVRAAQRFALAGAAAVADGVLSGALALTAQHIGTREQFGKPLATFQAVAGQIADVYVAARTMHVAALSANWRLAEGLDADGDVDVAAYWLATEVPPALQTCHHLHGGLGVDVTYPLHRYYAQGKDLARFVGGSELQLDRIGLRCASTDGQGGAACTSN